MKRQNNASEPEKYSIGRLLSPKDEALDLDEASWLAALELTQKNWKPDPGRSRGRTLPDSPSGPYLRRIRGPDLAAGSPEVGGRKSGSTNSCICHQLPFQQQGQVSALCRHQPSLGAAVWRQRLAGRSRRSGARCRATGRHRGGIRSSFSVPAAVASGPPGIRPATRRPFSLASRRPELPRVRSFPRAAAFAWSGRHWARQEGHISGFRS